MLSDIVLDSIEKLTNLENKPEADELIQAVPVSIIKSFLDRAEFLSAVISFTPWNSSIIGKRIIKRSEYKNATSCFQYRLELSKSNSTHGNLCFGEIKIFSNKKISKNEVKLLQVFSRFLSKYLENHLFYIIKKRILSSENEIKSYFKIFTLDIKERQDGLAIFWDDDQIELNLTYSPSYETLNRPGSTARKIVKTIYHYLKPVSVSYCTCDLDNFTLEYRKQKKAARSRSLFMKKKYLSSHNLQYLLKNKNTTTIDCLTESDKSNSKYLISPVTSGASTIGFFLFEYKNANMLYLFFARELLIHTSKVFSTMGKYLYQRRYSKLIIDPIFHSRETRVKQKNAFVIMPFSEDWSDRIWKYYIKPTIEYNGMNAIRGDDLFGGNVIEDIWQGILSAKIIVADITNRNANVFYELGIAHTLGKEVIILTQSVDDIPFDIKSQRCIIYSDHHDVMKN